MPRTILIRIDNSGVAFNDTMQLPLSATNLPHSTMHFRTHTRTDPGKGTHSDGSSIPDQNIGTHIFERFWMVEMQSFDQSSGILHVQVADYEPPDVTRFHEQKPRAIITGIAFHSLQWDQLSKQLSAYRKVDFHGLLAPAVQQPKAGTTLVARSGQAAIARDNRTFVIEFNYPLAKLRIADGMVVFAKRVEQYGEVEMEIENNFLLKEFDLLKTYIAKFLKKRTITVNAEIKIENGEISSISATSHDVDRLNQKAIESVRYMQVYQLSKTQIPPDVDKSLFSPEDLLSLHDQKISENQLLNDANAIIEALLLNENIRNRKQIVHLTSEVHMPNRKIRFTLRPQFGFLFSTHSEQFHHFIWEMLNSNATYIWSISRENFSYRTAYSKIEFVLSKIRDEGRRRYKQRWMEDLPDPDLIFNLIRHDKIASDFVDDFPVWRARLEEALV